MVWDKIDLPIQKIIEKYKSGKSVSSLARDYNVSRKFISNRLKNYNIPIRNWKDQKRIDNFKDYIIDDTLLGIIDGLLLGDAWLEKNNDGNLGRLCIEQREDRLGWLEILKKEFELRGIQSSILKRKKRNKPNYIGKYLVVRKPSFILKTYFYAGFARERDRWYPKNKKVIPKDIELTDILLTHWYCGDGTIDKKGYDITFLTNNFTWEDTEWLTQKINKELFFGVRVIKNRGKPTIRMYNYIGRTKLHNMVKDHIPECFKYKIDKMKIKESKNVK